VLRLGLIVLTGALITTGCGGGIAGKVSLDGSSTVYPLSGIAAEDFHATATETQVKVGSSGTGGGFEKFCRGELDANNASRPIKDSEIENCAKTGVEYGVITLATDAITVVVNPANDWATCLTTDQLRAIWEPGSNINNWNQVDPSFPDVPLRLFGPGTDSGTFDYFTEVINGDEGASRTDFTPSEDDNVVVQGVVGTVGGLGYFGYTYYEENADRLTAVQIDAGDGCVTPSAQTAQDGTYRPLARPLYVYVSVQGLARPEVREFFDFYVANDASIAEGAKYIPLNAEQRLVLEQDYNALLARAEGAVPRG
jgi:phosphate transport system substrate-binding protein